MKNPFRQIARDYFNFSKKDRSAVLVLATIIILFAGGKLIVRNMELKPGTDFSEIIKILEEWEIATENSKNSKQLFRFNPNTISEEELDSLNLPAFIRRNILSYRAAGGVFHSADDVRKIYGMNDSIFSEIEDYIAVSPVKEAETFEKAKNEVRLKMMPFNPNTASENELFSVGFNSFQASNLIRYRESGGFISSPEDLLKIYGIDSAFYGSIENFIEIDEMPEEVSPNIEKALPLFIELNTADSVALQQLRGIGPSFAARILKYRELLGGYHRKEQLLEVYGFPEETFHSIKENISTDTMKVKKIRINFAEYTELLRHPYIKKEQVDAILNYRQMHGPLTSNELLLAEGLVDSATFVVLRPYITCR